MQGRLTKLIEPSSNNSCWYLYDIGKVLHSLFSTTHLLLYNCYVTMKCAHNKDLHTQKWWHKQTCNLGGGGDILKQT